MWFAFASGMATRDEIAQQILDEADEAELETETDEGGTPSFASDETTAGEVLTGDAADGDDDYSGSPR